MKAGFTEREGAQHSFPWQVSPGAILLAASISTNSLHPMGRNSVGLRGFLAGKRSLVETQVGSLVGWLVGSFVGISVGFEVGKLLGDRVGDTVVGDREGDDVGSSHLSQYVAQ